MKFDPHRHHRRTIRLCDYDYSQPGWYFVTIVAYQRKCLFGQVVNGGMIFDGTGVIAKQQWIRLSRRFPNIAIGEFIIMPNHIHGIIEILEESCRGTAEGLNGLVHGSHRRAPTKEQFQKPIKGSIPTIIRSYKSAVTYRINLLPGSGNKPVWQRNYYEHVIRDLDDLNRISRYIESNPNMWEEDEENPFRIAVHS